MIRALVVDDEPLARQILVQMLADHEDVVVVGESASGTSALHDIHQLKPDLVLLDIQMPGMDGFEVLCRLPPHNIPEIIFVTAFDTYALKAFEVHALDYLLKPFDEQRLAASLSRAREHLLRSERLQDTRHIIELLQRFNSRERYAERIAVKTSDRTILLPVNQIDMVRADGKVLHITAGESTYTIRERLYRFGALLDARQFTQLSRSTIVNVSSIREIQPWGRGEYKVIMNGGAEATSTRAYRERLKKVLDLNE